MMYYRLRLGFLFMGLSAAMAVKAQVNKEAVFIENLVKQLTLAEKISILHGTSHFTNGSVERLGIPAINFTDGPHGIRMDLKEDWSPANNVNDSGTYLPVSVCLAATWNKSLAKTYGMVLGNEAKYRNKHLLNAPGINIMRHPLNGRNFEYFSEDPYLVSRLAVNYINGVQEAGVAACVKHFIANNQETNRNTADINMSNRALHEIYLPGFKASVTEACVTAVMGAYNKFRGQYCSHNKFLVDSIPKKTWKFKGALLSDWGAVHDTYEAVFNGTDIEMGTELILPAPDYNKFYFGDTLMAMVQQGLVPESIIDDKVKRTLKILYRAGALDKTAAKKQQGSFASAGHIAVAAKVAEEGVVLLKNENHVLPFSKKIKSILVVGAFAKNRMATGGGSSQVRPLYEITAWEGLANYFKDNAGVTISFAEGYQVKKDAVAVPGLISDAVAKAAQADLVIFTGGWGHDYDNTAQWDSRAFDTEAADKTDLFLPFGQAEVIKALGAVNKNIAVLLYGGGPVDMNNWIHATPAILQVWYPGMEGGNVLAKILFGDINPSGKLPVTFPVRLEDAPVYQFGNGSITDSSIYYKEDIYVGYRYYEKYKVKTLFPFGHGLSYTSFSYSGIKLQQQASSLVVRFTLKNTGHRQGSEVVQLYLQHEVGSTDRPVKELKSFEKVNLLPGQSKEITLVLDKKALQYYDEAANAWKPVRGKCKLVVGASVEDERLETGVRL